VRSLRSRLFFGALLWTFGLFAAAVLVTGLILMSHPSYPRLFHNSAHSHAPILWLIAGVCLAGGLWHVRRGVTSIEQLRTKLAAVRDGRSRRVDGRYPTEVQPLVDDLNALLAHREDAVARAISKAGDLAHGLKTPLAVLSHEAERARATGGAEFAAIIDQQVERMRRHTEYHLAQARAAASGATPGARSSVHDSAAALTRTLLRLHAARGLIIDNGVPPDHDVRCQREDLDEMLGNLLDNACKWARSRVVVTSVREALPAPSPSLAILVDDDGTGLAEAMRAAVLQRGVRADEAAPGSGLGLAIVGELATLYGGTIALDASPLGGVRAKLTLPASSQ
jgi:signal transduction histidine kinase